MRGSVFLLMTVALFAGPVAADPAVLTANVNFREGPGTGFATFETIKEGTQVDLIECDASGAWCAVRHDSKTGFVSGKYLDEVEADKPRWPRTYTMESGGEMTLYQPQITDWENFTTISALIAAEYRASKETTPIFGIIGVSGQTVSDNDTDDVVIRDVNVTEINFSTLNRPRLAELSLEVGKLMPTGTLTLSEERLAASLADYKRVDDVQGLKADPPPIFSSKTPAILVQTIGKPVFSPIKGVEGLRFAVNTNWDLLRTDADNTYYLRNEKSWLTSKDLDQNWTVATTLPPVLSRLPDDENWKDAHAGIPPQPFEGGQSPKVVYSDKPAELIQFSGEPALVSVPGTGLKWASNSENDVFYRDADARWYVLLSGRWFSSSALDGPWTFATPTLPTDFQNIPDDVPYYTVRSSVPGTSENAEARLRASIPRMARVALDGSVKVDVAYSGEPKFVPIEGTEMSYAVNTNELVIKVKDKYFVLKDGIWFVGDTATGPFVVAQAVPDEVYTIPPSSPVYNATYVHIYNTENEAVWYGYTMGYLGGYLAWDSYVYGTGWYYDDYWDTDWEDGNWPYYPPPITYGADVFYNPAIGAFGRYGYAYGPYRGIVGGAAYNPRTGTYVRGGAVAGPAGERGFVAAYNPRNGNAAVVRGGENVYGSWGSVSVKKGANYARVSGGSTGDSGAVRWRSSEGNRGFVAGEKGGDLYAGRDGSVYRRQDGQWQKHTDGAWTPVEKPSSENLKKPGENFAAKHPDALNKIQQRPNAGSRLANTPAKRPSAGRTRDRAPDHLAIDRAGRQMGNQRSHQFEMYNRPYSGSFDRFEGSGRGGNPSFSGGGGGGRSFSGGGGRGGAAIRGGGGGRGGGGRGGGGRR
ncbi:MULTISPECIES: SH3 domain-containing protein [unclassified Ensifer]|uniref:SH3 domain-containing protein n=1 Tax=unclassified Ensifer TaxID=2633371 RepID=UPI0009EB09EA|nr:MULTISPECIES: SH3 domain-containing protein [unclassified Ensifer]